jgi:hypothetical protein
MRLPNPGLVAALLGVTLSGCRCGGSGTVTVSGALLEACFESADTPLDMTVSGVRQATTPQVINVTGKLTNPKDSTVTWMVPGSAGTSTPLDGATATAELGPPGADGSRPFNASAQIETSTGTVTLTVTGTITGPPPPCSGSGQWSIRPGGLSGTWRIP